MWSALARLCDRPHPCSQGHSNLLNRAQVYEAKVFHTEDVCLVLEQNLRVVTVQVICPCLNSSS